MCVCVDTVLPASLPPCLQVLCKECGNKLTDSETTVDSFDPVALKIPLLKKQLETLQVSEGEGGWKGWADR